MYAVSSVITSNYNKLVNLATLCFDSFVCVSMNLRILHIYGKPSNIEGECNAIIFVN